MIAIDILIEGLRLQASGIQSRFGNTYRNQRMIQMIGKIIQKYVGWSLGHLLFVGGRGTFVDAISVHFSFQKFYLIRWKKRKICMLSSIYPYRNDFSIQKTVQKRNWLP